MKDRKKTGHIGFVVAVLLMVLSGATISWADWAQAESPDFPLDTTIPEPAALVLCGFGLALWRWRGNSTKNAGMSTAVFRGVAVAMCVCAGLAHARLATVANVSASQRADEPIVDLLNPSGGVHVVSVEVPNAFGVAYNVAATNFSGAIGAGVTTGVHKWIVWRAAYDMPAVIGVATRVCVRRQMRNSTRTAWCTCPAGHLPWGTVYNRTRAILMNCPCTVCM